MISTVFLFIALIMMLIAGWGEWLGINIEPAERYEPYLFAIVSMLMAIYFRIPREEE